MPQLSKRPPFAIKQKDKNCAGFELRKNKGKGKALQGHANMIKGEQGEGFIYEIVVNSNTSVYIYQRDHGY